MISRQRRLVVLLICSSSLFMTYLDSTILNVALPTLQADLHAKVGWRSVFWVNVPIGAAMLVAARRHVPESRAPRPRRVDVPGQLLMIVFLGTLTYAVIQGPASGWASAPILTLFAIAVAFAVLGAGLGLVNPPITNVGVSGMPPEQAGVASAVISSSRQLGNVLGVAVMGAMLTSGHHARLATGVPRAAALSAATHAPWVLAAACGVLVAVSGLVTTSARARATAHVTRGCAPGSDNTG